MELYIHIPFCKSKCLYCDFNSIQCLKEQYIFKYIEALKKEIILSASKAKSIDTIFIGGGTPSFIDSKYIKDITKIIFDNYNVSKDVEFTIECNPESITEEKLIEYKNIGINRISIGVQSLNDQILKSIGRLHTSQKAKDAINLTKKYFSNISCDLIIGLPNDNIENIQNELNTLCPLVNHISVYELILEEKTPLFKLVNNKRISIPDDDQTQDLFEESLKILYKNDYTRYEVSNFSKYNTISKHNFGYWTREEYLGVGAGAHSLLNNNRYSNFCDIDKYIDTISDSNSYSSINRETNERLTETDIKNEIIMLGLRTNLGIDKELISTENLDKYSNYFEIIDNNARLNDKGMAIMNTILIDILNI